jgi:plastocyanin
MKLRRASALTAGLALATVAAAAGPAMASSPKNHEFELRDECEATSFNAQFGPGFCTRTGSGVTFQEFSQKLTEGGSGAWWIRWRDRTIDAGDSVSAKNVGGIFHTFTEVQQYGKGCIPDFNVAVTEEVNNCDFSKFGTTAVPQGTTLGAQKLDVGVHKFQCLIHPWMRSTITVQAN